MIEDNYVDIVTASAPNEHKRLELGSPGKQILFAGDNGVFAVARDGRIDVMDVSGVLRGTLNAPGGPLQLLAASEDGEKLLIQRPTGALAVIATSGLRELCRYRDLTAIAALTPDGKQLLARTFDGRSTVTEVASCKTVRSFNMTRGAECQSTAIGLDSQQRLVELATCSNAGRPELRIL